MIDWTRVEELRSEVGEEAFDEVVALFLEEVDETVAEVAGLQDDSQIKDMLHFLKGSALNLGFGGFADLCSDGEQRLLAGGSVELDPILTAYQDSKSAFVLGLAERLSA